MELDADTQTQPPPQPSNETPEPMPGPSRGEVGVETSLGQTTPLDKMPMIRWSRGNVTPRKLKLKKRLDFMKSVRSAEKNRYKKKLKEYVDQLNVLKVSQIKYLKQEINRKKTTILFKDVISVRLKKDVKDFIKNRHGRGATGPRTGNQEFKTASQMIKGFKQG